MPTPSPVPSTASLPPSDPSSSDGAPSPETTRGGSVRRSLDERRSGEKQSERAAEPCHGQRGPGLEGAADPGLCGRLTAGLDTGVEAAEPRSAIAAAAAAAAACDSASAIEPRRCSEERRRTRRMCDSTLAPCPHVQCTAHSACRAHSACHAARSKAGGSGPRRTFHGCDRASRSRLGTLQTSRGRESQGRWAAAQRPGAFRGGHVTCPPGVQHGRSVSD